MMHPTVEALTRLLRPPFGGGDRIDWSSWRAETGFDFPADYKSFMEVYGAGSIDETLAVASLSDGALWWREENQERDYSYLHDPLTGEELEEPLTSGLGGLIFWGGIGADQFYWYAIGDDPDQWPVVAWMRCLVPEWVHHRDGFAAFLRDVMTRDLEPPFNHRFPALDVSDFLSWKDAERLKAAGISPYRYEADPRSVIAKIQAAGLDPVEFFPSATRFL